jgi:hypothetical protein
MLRRVEIAGTLDSHNNRNVKDGQKFDLKGIKRYNQL